jgi:4-aminobutyrate aminotransferase-like enzyme
MSQVSRELIKRRKKDIPPGSFLIPPMHLLKRLKSHASLMWMGKDIFILPVAGGVGVNNVGHSRPKTVKAITDQAKSYHIVKFYHP